MVSDEKLLRGRHLAPQSSNRHPGNQGIMVQDPQPGEPEETSLMATSLVLKVFGSHHTLREGEGKADSPSLASRVGPENTAGLCP